MAKSLRYHTLFDCKDREAANWYEQRSEGLGDAFVEVVRQCVTDAIAAIRQGQQPVEPWLPDEAY